MLTDAFCVAYLCVVCDVSDRVRSTQRLTCSSTRGSSPRRGSAFMTGKATRSVNERITLKLSHNSETTTARINAFRSCIIASQFANNKRLSCRTEVARCFVQSCH